MRVLIIDDDALVRDSLDAVLSRAGIEAVAASCPEEARAVLGALENGAFDVILLDVSMPGETGWDFLQGLREGGDTTPTIFLTGSSTVEERVRGLEMGADDFIAKPFETKELMARIEAVVRRAQSLPIVEVGDLRIDLGRRVVERAGRRIEISPREFDVLRALGEARGRVLSRSELLDRVWGIHFDPGTNVVEVQMARLRRKVDRGARPLIQTVVGEGYRLSVDEKSPDGRREPTEPETGGR